MAKVRRRTPTRSRRTHTRTPKGRRGFRLPLVPIAVLVAVVAVVGLIAYLIVQSGQESGDDLTEFAEVEANPAPDLPGEFVDLQSVYDGSYGSTESNTAGHVSTEVDYSEQGLPPAGGPHWSGGCGDDPSSAPPFCGPARWGIYRDSWEEETVVHNMEHGGVVVWYNTDDQEVVDDLEGVIQSELEDDMLIVMMPYDEMEEDTIALTSWGRRDMFPIEEYSDDRVREYIDVHERRFNPEHF